METRFASLTDDVYHEGGEDDDPAPPSVGGSGKLAGIERGQLLLPGRCRCCRCLCCCCCNILLLLLLLLLGGGVPAHLHLVAYTHKRHFFRGRNSAKFEFDDHGAMTNSRVFLSFPPALVLGRFMSPNSRHSFFLSLSLSSLRSDSLPHYYCSGLDLLSLDIFL